MTKARPKLNPLGLWAIALPLLVQTLLIVSVPLSTAIAMVTGKTVVLRTVPVDPYDPFRGYYVTLRYDISQRGILSTLEGWEQIRPVLEPTPTLEILESGNPFFVVLEDPGTTDGQDLAPWQPVAVSKHRPRNLPDNQIALQGTYRRDLILYGLERYYLPEADRLDLDNRIRTAQTAEAQPRLMVEVRVGPWGSAIPIALWLEDQRIEF